MAGNRQDPADPVGRGLGQGYEYVGVGFAFALAILLFGAAGWVLDGWVHTRPLFAILGALLGGFGGFMSIYYRVKRETKSWGSGSGPRTPGPGNRKP